MSTEADLSRQIEWDELVYSIYEQDCILMLGPEALVDPQGDGTTSLADLFSLELSNKLPDDQQRLTGLNPSQVAQVFKSRNSERALRLAAEDFYRQYLGKTSAALGDLANLPFRLVIDTTPIRYMENAFISAGKKPIFLRYYMKSAPWGSIDDFDVDNPLVYHLYGDVEETKSLVIAENDYVDLLVSVISENPPIPTRIVNEFRQPNKSYRDSSMLFVGFGLRHLSLRILLHVLSKGTSTGKSYALEQFSQGGVPDPETTKLFFQQGQQIVFLDMSLAQFAKQLRSKYISRFGDLPHTSSFVEKRVPKPKIFISYCRENEVLADQLRSGLQSEDIDVWIDVNDIRGGDAFDSTIEEAILKDVDCFLLVHTKEFVKANDSYVNKELVWAKQRAERIRGAFIIPLLMDEEEILWSLNKLHAIDLHSGSNDAFKRLVKDIRRCEQENRKSVND
ncbi:MAG: toll/interleukin-1 receptor domain-containing protein [Candidatus Thiodiazotropha sp.]